jgi:hypothetical protein
MSTDTTDAQAARDSIVTWQDKIRTDFAQEFESPGKPVRRK